MMPEARNPFDQLKAIKSFHQFIEEQAIAYFECDEPIRVAFKRMADSVGGSDPIKKPQRISRKTNAMEARADQLISEMQILSRYNATAFLETITKRWSMSKGPETCIAGMLLNHALTRQKNSLIELLKETDESTTELLNMKNIQMSIKTIPDDILDELKESRTPEIAERLRDKARQLQLELSDIRHWNRFLDYKLSDVAKRFHSAMSVEFPLPKPVRSKKSSEPVRPKSVPILPQLKEHDLEIFSISASRGITQTEIADEINEKHKTNYKQPRIAEAIARAKAFIEAGGTRESVSHSKVRANPPLIMNPHKLDLGERDDGKSYNQLSKKWQQAKDQEDSDE